MRWGGWISRLAHAWDNRAPACSNPACCARLRRLRIAGAGAGIFLQDAWHCSPQCFEAGARRQFTRARVAVAPTPRVQHRVPLGLLLLSRGHLSNGQLRRALELQRTSGNGRIGHWLEELGFATEQQITAALGLQWACPVLPPFSARNDDCARLLPLPLLHNFRLLPVHFAAPSRILHVAFADGIDYTALYAIEQMLECRTEPCLINASVIRRELESMGDCRRPEDLLFEGLRAVNELARITSGYALKLGARKVRTVACGEYLWVRLESENTTSNLWFARPQPSDDENELIQDTKAF